jgi:hypothetical protein
VSIPEGYDPSNFIGLAPMDHAFAELLNSDECEICGHDIGEHDIEVPE